MTGSGRRLTRQALRAHFDLNHAELVVRRFGSWRAAAAASALELSPIGRHLVCEEELLANLRQVQEHLGRPPTRPDP